MLSLALGAAGGLPGPEREATTFFPVNGGLSYRNSLTTGGPARLLAGQDKTPIQAPSVSLDAFCAPSGVVPTAIQIEVEGAERSVLQGARKLLRERQPALILEAHPYWLPPGQSLDQLHRFLQGCGYAIRRSRADRGQGVDVFNDLCSWTG